MIRVTKRLFKHKERLWMKTKSQDIEYYRDKGEARKIYQKVESIGFGTCIPTCKNRDGYLVTDMHSVLLHIRSTLCVPNSVVSKGSVSYKITPIIDDRVDCHPQCQNGLKTIKLREPMDCWDSIIKSAAMS